MRPQSVPPANSGLPVPDANPGGPGHATPTATTPPHTGRPAAQVLSDDPPPSFVQHPTLPSGRATPDPRPSVYPCQPLAPGSSPSAQVLKYVQTRPPKKPQPPSPREHAQPLAPQPLPETDSPPPPADAHEGSLPDWLHLMPVNGTGPRRLRALHINVNSPALATPQAREQAWADFLQWADRRLQDPEGPSWEDMEQLIARVLPAVQQTLDGTPWLWLQLRARMRTPDPRALRIWLFQAVPPHIPLFDNPALRELIRLCHDAKTERPQWNKLLDALRARPRFSRLPANAALQPLLDPPTGAQPSGTQPSGTQASPRPDGDTAEPDSLDRWFRIERASPVGGSGGPVRYWLARGTKAPQTDSDKEQAQEAVLTWVLRELADPNGLRWPVLMDTIKGIESAWQYPFDRQRLLALCVWTAEEHKDPSPLLQFLHLLEGCEPAECPLAGLIEQARNGRWAAPIRSALLQAIGSRLPTLDDTAGPLHACYLEAALALPDPEDCNTLCAAWLRAGQAQQAIALLGLVLSAVDDLGAYHTLLAPLAPALNDSPASAWASGRGDGVLDAIRALGASGWFLADKPSHLEPATRLALLQLLGRFDPVAAISLAASELGHNIPQGPAEPLAPAEGKQLAGLLGLLLRLGSEQNDPAVLQQALEAAKALAAACGPRPSGGAAALQARFNQLARAGHQALAQVHIARLSDWLTLGWKSGSGSRPDTLSPIRVQQEGDAFKRPKDLPLALSALMGFIDGQLANPQGVPWGQLVQLAVTVSAALERPFDALVWWHWCAAEAQRTGNPHALQYELERHPSIDSPHSPLFHDVLSVCGNPRLSEADRAALLGTACRQLQDAAASNDERDDDARACVMGWLQTQPEQANGLSLPAIQALAQALPWPFEAPEWLALCLSDARHRGQPQALIDWLTAPPPQARALIDKELFQDVLDLAPNLPLSGGDRQRLLLAAQALLNEHLHDAPLQARFTDALGALRSPRKGGGGYPQAYQTLFQNSPRLFSPPGDEQPDAFQLNQPVLSPGEVDALITVCDTWAQGMQMHKVQKLLDAVLRGTQDLSLHRLLLTRYADRLATLLPNTAQQAQWQGTHAPPSPPTGQQENQPPPGADDDGGPTATHRHHRSRPHPRASTSQPRRLGDRLQPRPVQRHAAHAGRAARTLRPPEPAGTAGRMGPRRGHLDMGGADLSREMPDRQAVAPRASPVLRRHQPPAARTAARALADGGEGGHPRHEAAQMAARQRALAVLVPQGQPARRHAGRDPAASAHRERLGAG